MRSLAFVGLLVGCGSVSNEKKDAAVTPDDVTITDDTLPDMAMATCATTPAGLKARYRAENNANDHTNVYPGTATGTNFTYVPGKYGMAFSLDGTDDIVTINDSEQFWPNTSSLTVEAWIKTTTSTGDHSIACKYACGDQCPSVVSQTYFCLAIDVNGHPIFNFRPDSEVTVAQAISTTISVDDGNWHHLVGARDVTAQTGVLYVDGVLAATVTPGAPFFSAMTDADSSLDLVTIGGTVNAAATTYGSLFTGQIDDVAFYHSALTAAEVSAIYSAPDGKCL